MILWTQLDDTHVYRNKDILEEGGGGSINKDSYHDRSVGVIYGYTEQ